MTRAAAAALVALAAFTAPAPPARADDAFLRGPHPFIRVNELSIRAATSTGFGDTYGGTKLLLDYGYRAYQPVWINVQLNVQAGSCSRFLLEGCDPTGYSGSTVEVVGGVKWKYPTQIPLVPHAKASGGLVFIFPDQVRSTAGLLLRAGGGATWFLYDWFGLGAEVAASVGWARHGDPSYLGSHGYAVLDVGVGAEVQFD